MAELYLGEAVSGDITRQVVLKRLLPDHADDPLRVSLFTDEARLAASLHHPCIVQALDIVWADRLPVIVLEHLDGTDLQRFRRRLSDDRQVPLEHALWVTGSVLRALAYAHERHLVEGGYPIVHQDVSPQNVFVCRDGSVKLLDFGIARTGDDASIADVLAGTVLYMSPEQCGGGDVDARTDVYATGVVLYQLLTGNVPFRAADTWQTMRAIIEKPAPRPRLLNPDVPAELDDIVLKALEKRAEDRWDSATAMLEALEVFAREAGLSQSGFAFGRFVQEVLGPRVAATSPDAPPPLDLASAELEPLPASLETSASRVVVGLGELPEELGPTVGHLEGLVAAAKGIEVQAAPIRLAEAIARSQPLRAVAKVHSVMVETRCTACQATGTASIPLGNAEVRGAPRLAQQCGRCGGALEVTSPLDALREAATSAPTTTYAPAPAGCLARMGTAAIVLFGAFAKARS